VATFDILASLGSNAFSLIIIVVIALIVGAIVTALMLAYLNLRKYKQFRIIIFEKDGAGNTVTRQDEAGVFVDGKTGNKRLFLHYASVGLSPDNIPFIGIGKERWVFLLRTGLKNFRYINVDFDGNLIKFTVGEEDVNWATNVYEAQKKRFAQGWLAQYLPFIIIGFTSIIMLIMFVWLFNKIGTIQQIADTMLIVADKLAAASSGTTIIPK
jgi:hypothetical protein